MLISVNPCLKKSSVNPCRMIVKGVTVMNNRKAFTLIELLIVLAIIALLVGILLPSITMVRRQAKETAQKAQFAAIDMALDAFKQDYGDYPRSGYRDGTSLDAPYYCGAQKLVEALLGWDLRGFHPQSSWVNVTANVLYNNTPLSLSARRGPYLEVAKTNVYRLGYTAGANNGLYNSSQRMFTDNFDPLLQNYVICDVFSVKKISVIAGGNVTTTMAGSPVLYYKANTNSKILTDRINLANNIYDLSDNLAILRLRQLPGETVRHNLDNDLPFPGDYLYNTGYKLIDENVFSATGTKWPHRPDSYILISAGWDHNFGTKDDILNF